MKKNTKVFNIIFAIICAAILIFLLRAPEETTAKVPRDEYHMRFFAMIGKKEAEKFCAECHAPEKSAPLPEGHPPKYRCLFCHKRK